MSKNISRRDFLKVAGATGAVSLATAIPGCVPSDSSSPSGNEPSGSMTMRTNPKTGEQVSLLGFGMMRLPSVQGRSAREGSDEIDQEAVNRLVDHALSHGVNYFDTAPPYCQGLSERSTGIALSRHPRDSYYIATKMSNFNPSTWTLEAGKAIYENSLKELQTDYIDYMLLHGVGMGSGMEDFNKRFVDNGLLDFLLAEREAGRIRNLGFSYHGDVAVFDNLLAEQDKYHWDFVQIQLNYLDWKYAKQINPRNTDAEYLYDELEKRGIPAVIMEPLLGGRLANVTDNVFELLKEQEPEMSVASWAFRFAGTHKGVLTVLSGMTRIEHLQDNINTYSPLRPLSEEEFELLQHAADLMMRYKTIPCNDCKYCMPCPYGVDIPAVLLHYNKCLSDDIIGHDSESAEYRKARRAFLVGYDRSVPKLRQAAHCIGCGQCVEHCPQRIDIPKELHRIDAYAERLRSTGPGL